MKTVLRTVGTLSAAPQLLVMLPGANMQPEELFEAGLAQSIARRGLALDLLSVDKRLKELGVR